MKRWVTIIGLIVVVFLGIAVGTSFAVFQVLQGQNLDQISGGVKDILVEYRDTLRDISAIAGFCTFIGAVIGGIFVRTVHHIRHKRERAAMEVERADHEAYRVMTDARIKDLEREVMENEEENQFLRVQLDPEYTFRHDDVFGAPAG